MPLYKLSVQLLMVLSSAIFVNKVSRSRQAMCKLGSCWQIPTASSLQFSFIYKGSGNTQVFKKGKNFSFRKIFLWNSDRDYGTLQKYLEFFGFRKVVQAL